VPAAPIRPSFDPRANAGVGGLAHSPGLPYQIQPSLIEGRTVVIEYRWAKGRTERYAEIAAEFVRRKVDVIVTYGTPSALAAKRSTAVIPIVFAAAGDPVASLARPGGNVTGLSVQQTDLAGKRLEILRELLPSAQWQRAAELRAKSFHSNMAAMLGETLRSL
jgi:hypothetical protein